MKHRIKSPEENDFSDARLIHCFSVGFLKKLELLEREREDFIYYLNNTMKSLEDNCFKMAEINKIARKIRDKSKIDKSIILMDTTKYGKALFFKTYKYKKKCLLCKNNRIQDCHIVRQSFFRNKKRLRRHYRNFKNHVSNIIFLCPNCHDVLDRTNSTCNSKIQKIIRDRMRLNHRLMKDIDKELKNIKKLNYLLDGLNLKMKKSMANEIKLFLRRL